MKSPAVIIYDVDGRAWAVADGVAIPVNTTGPLIHGSDGTNARRVRTAADGTVRTDPTGTTTQPISAATLPLPTGAAAEHTTAVSPHAARLTDGAAFYDAAKTGQLPAALVGGRLDENVGAWLGSTAPTVGQKPAASSLPVVIANDQGTESAPLIGRQPRKFYDAFGRFRVSNPETIFDSKQVFDKQPLIWDDQLVSGSGGASTYNTNQASTTLSVDNLTAAVRVRQTFERFNYQPGKSQMWMGTGIIGTPATGITRQIGMFDENNGVFFESAPSAVRVVIRSFTSGSAVNTSVNQSAWNLDKLDGTGASGITADWSKVQIFGSFFEWLGTGSVWFFVVIAGEIILVHRIDTANTGTLVYMSTPNLPMRFQITNDGTGGPASLVHICSTVISEGGRPASGIVRGINRGDVGITTNNDASFYPLFAARLKSGFIGAEVKLIDIQIACTSAAAYNWIVVLNPTVTGTALSFSSITNSAVEADAATTAATTVSGGTVLASGTIIQNNEAAAIKLSITDIRPGSNIAGTRDIIVVAVQRISGTTETFFGSINWRENL